MNRSIQRLGVVMLLLFGAVFVQLNVLQLLKADEYAADPRNTRRIVRDFSEPRGTIQTADGTVLARSKPVDDQFERLRVYPQGSLFSQVTGFFSFTYGTDGVERQYNDALTGREAEVRFRNVGDLFLENRPTANITLTLVQSVQRAAAQALGQRLGAVVALDPTTGGILALYSWPAYDANKLAVHNQQAVQAAGKRIFARGGPGTARAYRERYFPGSTFKIVTAAAGLESGKITPTSPVYPVLRALDLPDTDRDLQNYGGGSCGGALVHIIQVSCDTAFAQMALDIGAQDMVRGAQAFGFTQVPPIDLPGSAASHFPEPGAFTRDRPALAQSGIGQRDVQATPLQMALVAAAVANGGVIMAPHVMAEIRDDEGEVVQRAEPTPWRTALTADDAAILKDAMVAVVTAGTGTRAAIPGVAVAAKTGTAERTSGGITSAWMIAFAPADAPRVAVAVFLEGTDQTGSLIGGVHAAPIAKAVLEAALAVPTNAPN